MAHPVGEHAERVPDDGREMTAWMALLFGVLFACVFALHIITDHRESPARAEDRPPAAGPPRAG